MTTKCLLIVCGIFAAIAIYFPTRHARHYEYVRTEEVYRELNFLQGGPSAHNLKNCPYEDKILNNTEIDIESIYEIREFYKPKQGGEYAPKTCNPQLKVAIVVPYRGRPEQLKVFLNFMHNFLQNQDLWYRIFVVNQNNSLSFNRALMLNYGARAAMDMDYPCLVLHDVDLIPLSTGNIYGCGKRPRHMSSSLDAFRFNLPYLTLFGGAVSIQSQHYQRVNGMSNQFYGWGGEDDDFYKRLEAHNLLPYRFSPELSVYTMLMHKKEVASQERFNNLKYSIERHRTDGLSSLSNNYSIKDEDLYTLVNVL